MECLNWCNLSFFSRIYFPVYFNQWYPHATRAHASCLSHLIQYVVIHNAKVFFGKNTAQLLRSFEDKGNGRGKYERNSKSFFSFSIFSYRCSPPFSQNNRDNNYLNLSYEYKGEFALKCRPLLTPTRHKHRKGESYSVEFFSMCKLE